MPADRPRRQALEATTPGAGPRDGHSWKTMRGGCSDSDAVHTSAQFFQNDAAFPSQPATRSLHCLKEINKLTKK
jgi:hypothetical protein